LNRSPGCGLQANGRLKLRAVYRRMGGQLRKNIEYLEWTYFDFVVDDNDDNFRTLCVSRNKH
jgi:hypothetical protein